MDYELSPLPRVYRAPTIWAPSGIDECTKARATAPDVWVVLTDACGDNEQCLALAEALERPFRSIYLNWSRGSRANERKRLATLLGDDVAGRRHQAGGLRAPWPQLLVCCGQRATKVAFWIKNKSCGATKVVTIGRPRRSLADYDLLIVPSQFLVPERANVIHLPMALGRSHRLRDTGTSTASIPAPKPWFTILLGGRIRQFITSEAALKRTAALAQMAADRYGGAVVVSTSRRTSQRAMAAIESELTAAFIYRWSGDDKHNPYGRLLQESAAVFVTGDSVSMICDACGSGVPTYLVEFQERLDLRRLGRRGMYHLMRLLALVVRPYGLSGKIDALQDWLHAKHILRYPRNLRRLHSKVYEMRLARPAAAFDPSAIEPRRSDESAAHSTTLRAISNRCLTLLSRDVGASINSR